MSKFLVLNQTKSLLLKLKNDNVFVVKKKKNERVYTKRNKTPRPNNFNNNNEKHKLLRQNVPFKNQVEPSPTAIANGAIKRKPFKKKYKRGTTNHVCTVQLLKLLHKLVKLHLNLKFNKSNTKGNKCFKTLLHAKSDIMRNEHSKTFQGKSDIATAIKMKSNAMENSNSQRNDPEEYLSWALKVDKIFRLHNYEEEKKIAMASLEFQHYVLIWWEQVL